MSWTQFLFTASLFSVVVWQPEEKRFVSYLIANFSCVIVAFGSNGSGNGRPWLSIWHMSDSRLEEMNKFSRLSEYPASDQEFLTLVVLDEKNKC